MLLVVYEFLMVVLLIELQGRWLRHVCFYIKINTMVWVCCCITRTLADFVDKRLLGYLFYTSGDFACKEAF